MILPLILVFAKYKNLVFAKYTCKQVYTVFVNPVVIALVEALNLN